MAIFSFSADFSAPDAVAAIAISSRIQPSHNDSVLNTGGQYRECARCQQFTRYVHRIYFYYMNIIKKKIGRTHVSKPSVEVQVLDFGVEFEQ